MSCGVGCSLGLDSVLLWLWCRQVAIAAIRPLAWEPPYAVGAAQEMEKRQKKKKKKEREKRREKKKKSQVLGAAGKPSVSECLGAEGLV